MPTTRVFEAIGQVTAAVNWSAQIGGDTLEWIYDTGAWIAQWDGYFNVQPPATIGAHITVGIVSFYEIPQPPVLINPPVSFLQANIQALIDGGATITTIGASLSGSASADGRVTVTGSATPTTLVELGAWAKTLTVIAGPGTPELNVTGGFGFITLEIPDAPSLEYTMEGGVEISGTASALLTSPSEPTEPPMLELFMDGGVEVSGGDDSILSADVSGIYTLVINKTHDTLYKRIGFSVFVGTYDTKIPDPFVKTGFVGN